MRYRTLGKSGLKVGEVGIGGMGAAGKYGPIVPPGASPDMLQPHDYNTVKLFQVVPATFAETMACASSAGMNFVDTAPSYGDSELVFGQYLKDHREQWLVCSKIGVCGSWGDSRMPTRDEIFEQVRNSLSRLQIDRLDLVLIHSLDQYGERENAVDRVRSEGMLDAMHELQQANLVGLIGASGQLPELVPAVQSGVFDVVLTYNSFNLLVQDAKEILFPLARQMGTGVILGGAFYQGLLTGNPEIVLKRKEEFFEPSDPAYYQTRELVARVERLTTFVDNDAASLRRLALRFALSEPAVSVLVTGMSRPQEAVENAAAAELDPMTEAEIETVMAVAAGK